MRIDFIAALKRKRPGPLRKGELQALDRRHDDLYMLIGRCCADLTHA